MKRTLFLIASIFCFISTFSQEVSLRLGTEFPLQHYLGINYQHTTKLSADLTLGFVGSPYNDELYDWINVPAEQESRKDFLQLTTDDGWAIGVGGNLHKNKWYFGVYGQLIRLNASGSYREIINSDLIQNDIASGEKALLDSVLMLLDNPLGRLIVDLDDKISTKTMLFQLGLKAGRKFQFKDPKWSMNVELGITANMYANTTTIYDRDLAPIIESFAQNQVTGSNSGQIQENLDFERQGERIDEFFKDYGYIPGLRIGVSYLLYKK